MLHRFRLAAAAVTLGLVAAACGGGGSGSGSASKGSSGGAPSKDDIVAEVASFDLAVGPPSRILVGLYTGDQRFVVFGDVQFRFAYVGTKQENKAGAYGPPVTARFLAVPGTKPPSPPPATPQYTSGADNRGVYAAQAGFPQAGFYQVEVTAQVGGKARTATAALAVNETHQVPAPGEQALPTENLTLASTDAPQAAVDSRATTGEIPDPDLHQTTIAAALAAKRPAVLVISTPVYCQSRFCGPITDMVANLAKTYSNRATFVHIEVFRDGQNQVVNRAAAEWILRNGAPGNEPWVWVIGADGKIVARFDNVATQEELEPFLKQLPVL
jgi:hypothetical protein